MPSKKLLIIEDEEAICWGLKRLGNDQGLEVLTASSAEEALEHLQSFSPDVIFTDVRLPGISGFEAIRKYRPQVGPIPIIVMTAYGDLQTAVDAVRQGAFEYLIKPFELETARSALVRACALEIPHSEPSALTASIEAVEGFVAASMIMQEVFNRLALAAASSASILIRGESGTGKELAAHAIHKFSSRHAGPFVSVNLAALNPSLAESELFGHAKGSFTGADAHRQGLLVQAHGGTLFLDEVAEIPVAIQVKLLRALETQEVTPVGGNEPVATQFRIIAATHQDLVRLVQEGTFRHDLYFRLSGFQVNLPPLRERVDDIIPIAQYYLKQLSRSDRSPIQLAESAQFELRQRHWWGNVRELRNAIEHALIVSRGSGSIESHHLPSPMPRPLTDDIDLVEQIRTLITRWSAQYLLEHPETSTLHNALLALVEPPVFQSIMQSNRSQFRTAAKVLGLHRTTLKKKMDEYGLLEP